MNADLDPRSSSISSRAASPRGERPATHDSSAFVVRFWEEPREGDGPPVLRGYIKHLKTGREQYFSDLDEVPRLLGTDLEAEAVLD